MKYLHVILESMLLLEYNSDLTWKQHGQKIVNATKYVHPDHPALQSVHNDAVADSNSNPQTEEDYENLRNTQGYHDAVKKHVFPHIESTDPTPNKKYVQHVARMYGNGISRFEDLHARMRPALSRYHELASRKVLSPEDRDIGKVKTLDDLEDIVAKHDNGAPTNKEEQRAHHEKMKSEATITKHEGFTNIIPHTVESAKHFGQGTRWCTATKNPEDSMFNHYNSDGPLQIMIPHKPNYPGEKYQYHYDSHQLMNEKDHDVRPDDIGHGIGQHVHEYRSKIRKILDSGDHHMMMHSPEPAVTRAYARDVTIPKNRSEFEDLLKHPNIRVRESAANNVPQRHLDWITDDIMSNKHGSLNRNLAASVAKHPRAEDRDIDKLVSHPEVEVQHAIAPHLKKPEHIEKLLNSPHPGVRSKAVQNPNISEDQLRNVMNSGSTLEKYHAAANGKIPTDVSLDYIKRTADNKDGDEAAINMRLLDTPGIKGMHTNKAIDLYNHLHNKNRELRDHYIENTESEGLLSHVASRAHEFHDDPQHLEHLLANPSSHEGHLNTIADKHPLHGLGSAVERFLMRKNVTNRGLLDKLSEHENPRISGMAQYTRQNLDKK